MTNNNDWKEGIRKISSSPQDYMLETNVVPTEVLIAYIEKNFIHLSFFKKFIEENEKEVSELKSFVGNTMERADKYEEIIKLEAYNSALKLLKDKFIHNENKQQ